LVSMLLVLQDPEVDAEAACIPSEQFVNPYAHDVAADDTAAKFRATATAFKKFFNRKSDPVEQGRVIALALEPVMRRSTYQSQCVTHLTGDVQSLKDLMPPTISIRIHVEN
jgi:hypothetical protein